MKTRLEQTVLDLYDDAAFDQTLKKIASNLSEEVRQDQLPTRHDRSQLEDDQFALTIITKTASKLNKFPINNRVNTALSNEYFELNHHKMPLDAQKTAAAHIQKACDKYGIDSHNSIKVASMNHDPRTNLYVESASKPAKTFTKTAAKTPEITENYYALGTKYPMPDADFVKKAESYFDKFAKKFSPEDRHTYATNVTKRASELGVKLASKAVEKYAGANYNPDVETHLKLRQKLLDEASPYVPALRKLASFQDQTDPTTFAKVLHEIDKKAGLDVHYDKNIADPFAATFGAEMPKVAGYVYEKDNIYLTGEDIEKVASDKYDTLKNYFGPTLADGLKKEGAAAFMALPTDAQDIIARISNGEIQ